MSLALLRGAHPRAGLVPVWDALSAANLKLVAEIMANHLVVITMRRAWAETQRDHKERNFWIYRTV